MNFSLESLADQGDSPYLPEPEPAPILHIDFPEVIDNTAREQFFVCPQKFFRSTINKLAPRHTSEHLHFGGAFAMGLEVMRKGFYDVGYSPEDALLAGTEAAIRYYGDYEPPEGSFKTLENLILALDFYARTRPLETDYVKPHKLSSGKHAIEFTFAIPLPINHPVTGNPLLYAGRFDMLAEYQNTLFVMDDKTTSRLGPTWDRQWKLNSQFTGYCWAAQQHNLPVAGAIIRGQSILKYGFEPAEAIVYRPQWMIDRWYHQLLKDVQDMIDRWTDQYVKGFPDSFDYALGAACTAYSGCEFAKLCLSQNPESWIRSDYKQRHWNPLLKDPEGEK